MASGGPKATIPIDDSIETQVRELTAQLKVARTEVRNLEKEADKALKTTGKVGDEILKKIDDAKKKAGGLNAQIRGTRSMRGAPIPSLADDRPTAREAMRNFKDLVQNDGLKDIGRSWMGGTRIGGTLGGLARGAGSLAQAAAVPAAAFGLFATGVFRSADRNFEAEGLERGIRAGRLTGQDTAIMQMELTRSKIDNATGFKIGRDVADVAGQIAPIFGTLGRGAVDSLSNAARLFSGVDDRSIARAKIEKMGVSAQEYRRAQIDADGNAIKTILMDKAEGASNALSNSGRMFGPLGAAVGDLSSLLFGGREKATEAKIKERREGSAKELARGYALVDTNNFGAAQDAFNESARLGDGKNKAIDAVQAWQQGEASMRARLEYEKTQRKVPAYRMGM